LFGVSDFVFHLWLYESQEGRPACKLSVPLITKGPLPEEMRTGKLRFTWKTAIKVKMVEPDPFRRGHYTAVRIIECDCYKQMHRSVFAVLDNGWLTAADCGAGSNHD